MSSIEKTRASKIQNLEKLFRDGDMSIVIPEALELTKKYPSETAYNILALAHKRQGSYDIARDIYEELLVNNPNNAVFLGNLGNIYYDVGRVGEAEECYQKSLKANPGQYNVMISLGNLYSANSKLDDALFYFEKLLNTYNNITALQLDDVNYRVAEIFRKKGSAHYDKAIHHYGLSNQPLSMAHRLECIYVSKDKTTYSEEEAKANASGRLDPLLAAVQTHASIRYETTNKNLFCRNPFEYIYHSKLTSDEGFSDDLITKLLEIKNSIDSTPQPLLNNGEQSAGNLLLSSDPNIQKIRDIIFNRIAQYRDLFKYSNDGFIKNWPQNSICHGWIIDLKKGGNLDSHMHKQGWLSGSLYLNLQKPAKSSQGNIVFDLKGADYPTDGKIFPHKEVSIEKGDIVLFPSSIFHRTLPFESEEHRVTLAFDVKPI